MKPFRSYCALACDGGGIRAMIAAEALRVLETYTGAPVDRAFSLFAGTSAGAILAAGFAVGKSAGEIVDLFQTIGTKVFVRNFNSYVNPLASPRYDIEPLEAELKNIFGDIRIGDLWTDIGPRRNLLITVRDACEDRIRFIKSWKAKYADWRVWKAALASCAAPTYFRSVDGRYIDGGVSAYNNPSMIAAYEMDLLGWPERKSTLVSLGTGRFRQTMDPYDIDKRNRIQWAEPVIDDISDDANDHQVRFFQRAFRFIDYRRFQVQLKKRIKLDDSKHVPLLLEYGAAMGEMMMHDKYDPLEFQLQRIP